MSSRDTVARVRASLEAQDVQINNLVSALNEALDTIESQGQLIAGLELEVARAHTRLDKASVVVKKLSSRAVALPPAATPTPQATKPATTTGSGTHQCTVPGSTCDSPHTAEELKACWITYHTAKTSA